MTVIAKYSHPTRIYFLDNLRTFMIFLIVVLHSGLVYECTGMAGFFWIVYDFSTNTVVNEINLVLDIFIMATIFFVSGYFTSRSLKSKLIGTFLRSKLQRLMKRLRGQAWRPLGVRLGSNDEVVEGNQLDYPEAERADVLLGLTAFATDDACATRLARLYSQLPAELKALGGQFGNGTPTEMRKALRALMVSPR